MTLYETAQGYVARGLSVIPVGPDKRPTVSSWGEYQRRLPTAEELWRWWGTDTPAPGIGIVCGAVSGIVVVDVDPEGMERIPELGLDRAVTATQSTPRGGFHYLFRHPGGHVPNAVGLAGRPGVDVRGDGGYIVAAPTASEKGCWQWVYALDDHSPGDLPPAILELVADRRPRQQAAELPARIPAGSRNTMLASMAGSIRRRGGTEEEILAALVAMNRRCEPPLEQRELESIARSMARRPAGPVYEEAPEPTEEDAPAGGGYGSGSDAAHSAPPGETAPEGVLQPGALPVVESGYDVVRQIEREMELPAGIMGARTGVKVLDAHFGGLADHALIVTKAWRGTGKSHWGVQVGMETLLVCGPEGYWVLVYVLEGGLKLWLRRALSRLGDIDSQMLRRGGRERLAQSEAEAFEKTVPELFDLPLAITDQVRDIGAITDDIRRVGEQHRPALVIVDHLQCIRGPDARMRDFERYTAIAYELAAVSMELRAPLLLLSQITLEPDGGYSKSKGGFGPEEAADDLWQINRGPGRIRDEATGEMRAPSVEEKLRSPELQLVCQKTRDGEMFDAIKLMADFSRSRFLTLEDYAQIEQQRKAAAAYNERGPHWA